MGAGDFYVSSRRNKYDDFAWEAPVNLGSTVNSLFDEFGPTGFEPEGTDGLTLYFNSNRPGGPGGHDIYSTETGPDGIFLPPALVPELSSPADDTFPAVTRADGVEIFLASNRAGTLGNADLWTATRNMISGTWSIPENLGSAVNSPVNEQRPTVSWFGNSILFHSNRGGNPNLYETTRNIPVVTDITFDPPNISSRSGGTFTTTMSGTNLNDKTYFDIRFRRPGATTDETVLNWQQGPSVRHSLPLDIEAGIWIVTGVRTHIEANDHTGTFNAVSASLNVVAF
jgi:hypothetical protein